jgi:hypothetical protein
VPRSPRKAVETCLAHLERAVETCFSHPEGRLKRFSCHPERRPEGVPVTPKSDRNVFPPLRRATRTSSCYPGGLPERKKTNQQLSWSFVPLRRLSLSKSTQPRFATPSTFRPQGFSPSRRFPPRSDVRPCFVPVTPMGFRSPGGFPHCQVPGFVTPEIPS